MLNKPLPDSHSAARFLILRGLPRIRASRTSRRLRGARNARGLPILRSSYGSRGRGRGRVVADGAVAAVLAAVFADGAGVADAAVVPLGEATELVHLRLLHGKCMLLRGSAGAFLALQRSLERHFGDCADNLYNILKSSHVHTLLSTDNRRNACAAPP